MGKVQSSFLQHYSVLRNPHVALDVALADNGSYKNLVGTEYANIPTAKINGSAISTEYQGTGAKTDSGQPSGFGMFTDKVGNLIIFLMLKNKKAKTLYKEYLNELGQIRDNGSTNYPMNNIKLRNGYIERSFNSNLHLGYERYVNYLTGKGAMPSGLKNLTFTLEDDTEINVPKDAQREDGNDRSGIDFYKVLKYLEVNNYKLNTPLVIWISEYKDNGFADIFNTAFDILFASASALGVPPLLTKIVKSSVAVAEGRPILGEMTKFVDQNAFLTNLKNTGEMLAPGFTKGADAVLNGAETRIAKFGSYLNKAGQGADGIINSNKGVEQLRQITGLSKAELDKFRNRYSLSNLNIQNPIDMRQIKGSMHEANKVLRNTANLLTNDNITKSIESKAIFNKIDDAFNFVNVPAINDMFIGGGTGASLRSIAQSGELIGKILRENNTTKKEIFKGTKGTDGMAGLIASAYGYKVPENAFDGLTYEALRVKAEAHQPDNPNVINKVIGGTPFVMPDSIPDENKHKFAKMLKEDTGVDVYVLTDGWDWSQHKRKLVAGTLALAVGGLAYSQSKTVKNAVDKGAKKVSKATKKSIKTVKGAIA